MANQQATIHSIPLATTKLNTSLYKNDIKPYVGFTEINSPVYGDILCPLYTKTTPIPLANSYYVANNGDIYYTHLFDKALHKIDYASGVDSVLMSSRFQIGKYADDTLLPNQQNTPQQSNYFTAKIHYKSDAPAYQNTTGGITVWTSSDGGKTYYQGNRTVGDTYDGRNWIVTGTQGALTWTLPSGSSYTLYGVPITQDANDNTKITYLGGLAHTYCKYTYNGATYQVGMPIIRALFNNGELQGFSVALDEYSIGTLLCPLGSVASDTKVAWKATGYNGGRNPQLDFQFTLSNGQTIHAFIGDQNPSYFQVFNNRYLLTNYAEYYNAFDIETQTPFHWASDFNGRCIEYNRAALLNGGNGTANDLTKYWESAEGVLYASGQGTNPALESNPFIGTQFAPYLMYALPQKRLAGTTFEVSDRGYYTLCGFSPESEMKYQIYRSRVQSGDSPLYQISMTATNDWRTTQAKYQGTRYANNEFLGIPSAFAGFTKSYLNLNMVNDSGNAYRLMNLNGTKPIVAYSLDDEIEQVDETFVVQGTSYIISNKIIYRYEQTDGILTPCVNIGNMKYIGSTSYNAIFYSNINSCFYSFTGDNGLNLIQQANEVDEVVGSSYNPDTMSVFANVYAFNPNGYKTYAWLPNQLYKININQPFRYIYPVEWGMAFASSSSVQFISYNHNSRNSNTYTRIPIEFTTAFYGRGDNIVSVNDCVYLRIYKDDVSITSGKVELQALTLKQGQVNTETKTFNITAEMWDSVSDTIFLRFQPRYQEATGFAVKVKSDFAIAELKISETPVTVQNSKYNL